MSKDKKRSPFNRLMEFAKPHRGGLIGSVLLAIIGVATGMIPYFATANIVVKLLEGVNDKTYYFQWCVIAVRGYFMKVIFSNLSTAVSHAAAFATLKDIRLKLAAKLSDVPMGYFIVTPTGKLKDTIVDKVEGLEKSLAHLIPEITSDLLVPICIIGYLFILDYRMALVSLITMPLGFLCFMSAMVGYEAKFKEFVSKGKHMNSTVIEYVNGIEVIKAFNQSANSYEKYSNAVNENASHAYNWMKSCQLAMSMGYSIWPGVLISVLPIGWYFYSAGTLSAGIFVTVIILSLGIIGPIVAAMQYVDGLAQAGTIINDICQVLDEKELIRPIDNKKIDDLKIELKDVKFTYEENENEEKQIINGVDLTIEQGSVTAFVGPSGGGKSTLTKLIAGFWDVTEGSIKIGGVDIREIPQTQLNDYIAYVSQDNYLFDDSVLNNIRMGRERATDKEIIASAKACGCHDFIMKLENGYQTVVGGAGGHLSGGERQRIAIARAMLKDAPIIILDEATAYTDPESEAVIQEAVAKLVEGKTLMVIAHRLSTVSNSDKLVVVKNGTVHAEGKHQELLQMCQLYKDMWEAHIGAKDSDTNLEFRVEGREQLC